MTLPLQALQNAQRESDEPDSVPDTSSQEISYLNLQLEERNKAVEMLEQNFEAVKKENHVRIDSVFFLSVDFI